MLKTEVKTLPIIFQNIWINEEIPNSWEKGLIVKLPKKGDATDCNNWRGITLFTNHQ
uniref:Reverse transcriptase domain-containing protein n=1 Tax=Octopus bimaculoides TaxID=37653 RepID=A0A0L8GYX4_OCTBM